MDFAVAANLVGDDTVLAEGEETVTCADAITENSETRQSNFKDFKLHTPGDRYVLGFCV